MDLRYPIGQFDPIDQPTPDQLHKWIEDIYQFPADLRKMLQHFSLEQQRTPYRPDGWTVRQVVHHLADTGMNAYLRFKRGLTEDNPVVSSFHQDVWAELSDSVDEPIETSLLLIESLNSRYARLLRTLSHEDFLRRFTSPTLGVLTLQVATQRYVWHSRHHAAQIKGLIDRNGW